jgi:hypothetical protein
MFPIKSKSKSKSHYDRQLIGQSVLMSGAHMGPATNFSISLRFSWKLYEVWSYYLYISACLLKGRIVNPVEISIVRERLNKHPLLGNGPVAVTRSPQQTRTEQYKRQGKRCSLCGKRGGYITETSYHYMRTLRLEIMKSVCDGRQLAEMWTRYQAAQCRPWLKTLI